MDRTRNTGGAEHGKKSSCCSSSRKKTKRETKTKMEDGRKLWERNWRNAARNRDIWQKVLKKALAREGSCADDDDETKGVFWSKNGAARKSVVNCRNEKYVHFHVRWWWWCVQTISGCCTLYFTFLWTACAVGWSLYICSAQSSLVCGGGQIVRSALHVCELQSW